MTFDTANREAIARARVNALTAGTRPADIDPNAEARQHLRSLGTIAPGPAVAEALLALGGTHVVPLDPDRLTPTAEPFTSFSEASQHFQQRYGDGVGLQLGPQPHGGTLVALRATAAAWSAWLAINGTERHVRKDDDGRVVSESKSYLDTGRYCRVHWSPPPMQARATAVAVGRAMIEAEGEKVRADRAGVGEIGWVAWAVGTAWAVGGTRDGQRLTFANRQLDAGVALLATGVLPMAARRGDGWSLSCTGLPTVLEPAEFPTWLIDAFGGRWVK